MIVDVYRRAQVEWALWKLFTRNSGGHGVPNFAFESRIRKLLELDRTHVDPRLPKSSQYAFSDAERPGTGGQLEFTPENIFCLAIALDLMELGFKQAEVVFLLRHTRHSFGAKFRSILSLNVPFDRTRLPAKDFRQLPPEPRFTNDHVAYADPRQFAIIRRLDLGWLRSSARACDILSPAFAEGLTHLSRQLAEIDQNSRKAVVLEIASAARLLIQKILPEVPEVRRGRPAK
jgi:hypothetical protein